MMGDGVSACAHQRLEEGLRWQGLKDGSELPNVGARNQTQVLSESSIHS